MAGHVFRCTRCGVDFESALGTVIHTCKDMTNYLLRQCVLPGSVITIEARIEGADGVVVSVPLGRLVPVESISRDSAANRQ